MFGIRYQCSVPEFSFHFHWTVIIPITEFIEPLIVATGWLSNGYISPTNTSLPLHMCTLALLFHITDNSSLSKVHWCAIGHNIINIEDPAKTSRQLNVWERLPQQSLGQQELNFHLNCDLTAQKNVHLDNQSKPNLKATILSSYLKARPWNLATLRIAKMANNNQPTNNKLNAEWQ